MTSNSFRLILFILLPFVGSHALAQLTNGRVEYSGKITNLSNQSRQNVQNSSADVTGVCYFNADFTKLELTASGSLNFSATVEKSTQTALVLDNSDHTSVLLNLNDARPSAAALTPVDKTKMVCGYECKAMVLKHPDGRTTYFWYTEDIQPGMVAYPHLSDIPGICLEFTISNDEYAITYTATRVMDEAPTADRFSMAIPTGYTGYSEE